MFFLKSKQVDERWDQLFKQLNKNHKSFHYS